MRTIVVIPARYASTRFPGKPLAKDTGRYLIEHVWERAARAARPERVVVATDDERIAEACRGFGAEVAMTPAACRSGTDRCAAAARDIACEAVVNVQGDEPELDPEHVDRLVEVLEASGAPMATLAARERDAAAFADPNVVKVVLGASGDALYFTRASVPYVRGSAGGVPEGGFLRHIGIYAYRKPFLEAFASWEETPLERDEALEQLRALERGQRIAVGVVGGAPPGIDTPEQYRAFVERQRQRERELERERARPAGGGGGG